ncbi:MAG: ABC transporter substrate-binding protein, partial [Thaumarchaeota archaeon]|nr:ABC transporter substrate-binding protein [Nitrososphaerota archaeon]
MRRLTPVLSLILVLGLVIPFSVVFAQQQGTTLVDDFGRVVVIPSKPMRIVSTAPSITEILFALGLEDRVVGVTSYCNYPPEVLERVGEGKLEVIGDFTNPSLEKIIGLNPDLVIGHN